MTRTAGSYLRLAPLASSNKTCSSSAARPMGMRAMKIHRIKFGGISLGGLRPGMCRPLSKAEIKNLKRYG